jgi:hypothetical protein
MRITLGCVRKFYPVQHFLYTFIAQVLSVPVCSTKHEIQIVVDGTVWEQTEFLVYDTYLTAKIL